MHGVSFGITPGEIFGFLRPSGAGKSTTQKILIGLLKGSVRALTLADLRSNTRDTLLKFMMIYPWVLALLVRWLVPLAAEGVAGLHDVYQYDPLIGALFGVLLGPMMVGVTVGFLLLDERDDRTLTAIQVTPMSMNAYLVYRLAIPLVVSTRAVVVGIPIMGLMAIPSAALAPIALLAALEAPIFALVLASYAANKVEGFAVMKAMGVFLIGPTLACFVAEPWQWLFGVLPTYWPVKACWMALEGRPIWPVLAAGLVVYTAVLVALLRRCNRVVYRLDR